MSKIKIVAVSYTNTLPFIYGLQNSGFLEHAELDLQVPAMCAKKLFDGNADIGLVPIATLHKLSNFKIITDYCLGTQGPVKTVLLLSQKPIEDIEDVFLDTHSKTSVGLIKILSAFFWKKEFNWISYDVNSINDFQKHESILAIGDKTFKLKQHYKFVYDLSEQWKMFTGLPFVFACWVSIKKTDEKLIQKLNEALKFGVDNIELISKIQKNNMLNSPELLNYLQNDMNFIFDSQKREAMDKYFQLLNQL